MALESGTYISDLVNSNPASTDQKSKGDDHIRLIKSTLKATFPSINGAVTATQAEINKLVGATITTAELNNLHGVTSSTAELNLLDGATVTTAEINYLAGVTSVIQAQINTKSAKAGETYTGSHNFSGASGVTLPAATSIGSVSAAEILFLDGVTSAIQAQFSAMDAAKADIAGETYLGVHNFSAVTSITVPTRSVGTSGAYAASVDFVNASLISANASLPGQVGNAGKFMKTDGTNPSWAYVMAYIAKSAGFTAVAGDSGSMFDCTGTWTLAIAASSTLGPSWYCYIRNAGSGVITIDPNSSETIGGSATYSIYPGHFALVQSNGSVLRVGFDAGPRQTRLPIFSQASAAMAGVSVLEDIALPAVSTLLSATDKVIYSNGLFIASGITEANVSTSPDGQTWTLRAMPSSAYWNVDSNGSDRFIAVVNNATTTAKSTNGTTWTSGTALPAAAGSGKSRPVFNGNTALVLGSSTNCFTSADNGTSWSASQTLPADSVTHPFSVGGLFVIFTSSTTYYTSATGATGSWTSRTLPVTPVTAQTHKNVDGDLLIRDSDTGTPMYKTTNGINWASCGVNVPSASAYAVLNGVPALFVTTFPGAKTYHNGAWVQRISTAASDPISQAKNGSGVVCFASGAANISRYDPSATTPTAIFEG